MKKVRDVVIAPDHIKVQDRIIQLGLLNDTHIKNIYSKDKIHNDYFIKTIKHPGSKQHRSMLQKISHEIATTYKNINGTLPNIIETQRINYYNDFVYTTFGDDIIREMFYVLSEEIRYDKNIHQLLEEYNINKDNNI